MSRPYRLSVPLLVVALCFFVRASAAQESGSTRGVVWQGKPGVHESVRGIMARPALPLPRPLREAGDRVEWSPDRSKLPQNPFSPFISQYPQGGGPLIHAAGPLAPQTVSTSFLGAKISESGDVPPDSMGAVGPSQFLVCVNGRIKVFDKSGSLGGLNTDTDNFFSSVLPSGATTTDPQVRYDRLSRRWFVTMITFVPGMASQPANDVLIAVSDSDTIAASSDFTFYSFEQDLVGTTPNADAGAFADYDSLGVDANALYIGVNMFNATGSAFLGTTGFVVQKSSVLSGGPIVATAFRQMASGSGSGPYSPRGVDNDDPASTEGYFIGVDNVSFGLLSIRRISDPGGTPSISSNITVTVPSTYYPISVPAQGSTKHLDAIDDRLFAAQMRDGNLWTAHNIEINSSGVASSSGGRDGARWYELQNLTGIPTLAQSGTLFDSSASSPVSYWMPSCIASGQGHMALSSSVAGANLHAEVATAGRLAGDPAGTLELPAVIAQTSSTAYNVQTSSVQRWGDYSFTSVDPTDDMTLWTIQEYCNGTNSWGVRVIKLLAPPPARPSAVSPPSAGRGASLDVAVTGTSSGGSGFFDPDGSFPNHIFASINGGGVTVNSVTYTDPTHVTINVTVGSGAMLGARSITVTNPDGQSSTSASAIFTVTCPTIALSPAMLPNGQVGTAYSQSVSASGGTVPYSYSVTSGSLPANLTLNSSTGLISGTPTTAQTATFTLTATDANGCTGSKGYSIVVAGFVPVALGVDVHSGTGTSSNLNGVFEPGESVLVDPSWTNVTSGPVTRSATASNFTGPSGATYTIGDASANYGTVLSGATSDCYTATGNCYRLSVSNPATRPAGHWDATFVETLSTGGTKTWTVHIGNSFTDVPTGNLFYKFVETLFHDGVTAGCSLSPPKFCPDDSITKAQMAVFILESKHGVGYEPPAATGTVFTDVKATDFAAAFIEELKAEGISIPLNQCGTDMFCPGATTTRRMMASMLLLGKHGAGYVPPAATGIFTDVPVSDPDAPWIEELYNEGITAGCSVNPKKYCPDDPNTRGQMSVFQSVTFGLGLYQP